MSVSQETLEYFNFDPLPASVFYEKYAARCPKTNEVIEADPSVMHHRLAKELARIEAVRFKEICTATVEDLTGYNTNTAYSEDFIYGLLEYFGILILQGSPMAGIGSPAYVSLSNCFAIKTGDSYGSICRTDEQLCNLYKRRSGVGVDISPIRPDSLPVSNASRTSTGILPFMERFSNTTREVGQGGRRGALMISISVHHPQVLDFARIKLDGTKVTGANVSVRLTDEFMQAVKDNLDYEQRWPVDSPNPTVCKMVNAREIWMELIRCAWLRAEPGLLFWDTIIRESPADCYSDVGFKTIVTNPCGEIPLCELDSCRLLVVNLFSCVKNPFTKDAYFDIVLLKKYAYIAQRLMDSLIDLEIECITRIIKKVENDPEEMDIKITEINMWKLVLDKCEKGRRTGTGITALGDALAAIDIKYGSSESIKKTEEIYKTMKLGAYRSSVDMAKELGAFPIWDKSKEVNNPFLHRIFVDDPELYLDMQEYGRRNIALLTTAPTGTVSICAGPKGYYGTTSGIEPLFTDIPYTRRKKLNHGDKESKVDFIDEKGDKWVNYDVFHSKIKMWMEISGNNDYTKSPYHKATANDLNWKQRVKLQAAAQRHVDHSISSCLVEGSSSVLTTEGLKDIGELAKLANCKGVKGQFTKLPEGIKCVNKDGNIVEISDVYCNGEDHCLSVDLSNGSNITGTPRHKLLVLTENYETEWKELALLEEGDWVIGRKGLHVWGSVDRITKAMGEEFEYEKRTNSKDVTIPTRMTPSLARLLGYLCSDGHVSGNGIGLTQLDNNVGPDFIERVKTIFDLDVSDTLDQRSSSLHQYVANSREVSEFFKWLGITNHDVIRVPNIIKNAGKITVKEFIKGATLDGYVAENLIAIASSISKEYLHDLRELLLNFGIESCVRLSSEQQDKVFPNGKTYTCQDSYVLTISDSRSIQKYAIEIGFAEDRKNEEVLTKYKRPSRIKVKGEIPDYNLRLKFRNEFLSKLKSNKLYCYANSLCNKDKQGRDMNRETLQEMCDFGLKVNPILLDDTYTFSKVTKISDAGIHKTYDISVPEGNSYVVNGVISHNTVNLPEDVSIETVAEIYMSAYDYQCKGMTVYRDKCRSGVLIDKVDTKKPDGIIQKTDAPKRPVELEADIHRFRIDNKYHGIILVGLLNGDPYEVFTAVDDGVCPSFASVVTAGEKAIIHKERRGQYTLKYGEFKTFENIGSCLTGEQTAISRLISAALRHGTPISVLVHQLEKIKSESIQSYVKGLARILKKYIKDGTKVTGEKCTKCESEDLIRQESCITCKQCGNSKCS